MATSASTTDRSPGRGPHFKPAPGRYVAFLTPTDIFHNVGRTRRLDFTIRGAPRTPDTATGRGRADPASGRAD